MKKFLLFLMFALFCIPWAANAQETLHLYEDATGSNSYIPVYGTWADAGDATAEFIIPASDIEAMIGGTITKMTFFLSSQASSAWNAPYTVYLSETDATTLTGLVGHDQATLVFTGTLNGNSATMDVEFDNGYTYNGGNLLVGFYETASATYSGASFKGKSTNANTAYYGYTGYSGYTSSASQFLPTIDFTYTPGSGPVCATPETMDASNMTENGATLTWTGGSGNYNVEYKLASGTGWTSFMTNTAANTCNLTGLTPGTAYQARVQSVCDDATSGWKSVNFTTSCGAVTTFPWTETFESYASGNFEDPCWVNEHIEGTGTSVFKIYTSSNAGNTTHQLQLPDMEGGTLTKLVLPEMTLPANYEFSIDIYRSNSTYNDNNIYEGVRVYASTDGEIEGATELAFIPRQYNTSNDVIPAETAIGWYTYELPIGMSGTCYIILRGESQYCTATYMDNLTVKAMPSCPKPTSLAVTANSVTAHSATITWTENGEANNWLVTLSTESDFSSVMWLPVEGEPTYTFTGLDPETTYYVKVQANCGEDDFSEYSNEVNFTTAIACPAPTGLTVSDVTAHGATLTWDAEDGAIFQYGYEANPASDFDPANEVSAFWDETTNNTLTWNSGFVAETPHTFYLRKNCGTEGYSEIVSVSFTTGIACPAPTGLAASDITGHTATLNWNGTSDSYVVMLGEALVSPSTIDFEDQMIPSDWTNDATYPWVITDAAVAGGTYSMKSGNTGVNSSTSSIQITGTYEGTTTLEFDARCSSEQTSLSSDWDYGTFYIDGVQKGDKIINSETFTHYSYEVEAGTHTFMWKYKKDSSVGSNDDCLYVDNIVISVTTVNSWTEYTTTAQTYTFDNLTPETTYQVKVKGDCGEEGESLETAPISFTTLADCPVLQNLDVTTDGATATATWTGAEGTSNIKINGTVYNNVTSPYEFEVELSTMYEVMVQANCAGDETGEWSDTYEFTTPACVGARTIEYTLNDSYGDGWNGNAIKVLEGCGDIVAILTIEDGSSNTGTLSLCGDYYQFVWVNGSYPGETSFTFTENGTTLFTKPSSISDGMVLYTIGTQACAIPTGLDTSSLGTHSVELSWTSEATAWQICVNGDEDNLIDVDENPYVLSNLDADADYTVKVRANCSETEQSCWSDEVSFHTLVACPKPTDLTYSINADGVTVGWEGSADGYEMEYAVNNNIFDFDDGTLQGWTNLIVNEDGGQWLHSNGNLGAYDYTGYAHGGTGFAMCYSYVDYDGAYNTDAYLVSPQMYQINEGASLNFWYDMANDAYPEDFAVCVATAANPTASDFTSIWSSNSAKGNSPKSDVRRRNIRSNNWRAVSVDLSSYAGQSIWIAFRDVNEDMYEVWIDDITIDNGDITWIPVEGTVTSPYTLNSLESSTSYIVRVHSICNEEASAWSTLSFTTPASCGTGIVLNEANPTWTANFDNMTNVTEPYTGVQPSCWTWTRTTEIGDLPDTLPHLYNNSEFAHSGDYSLRLWFRGVYAMPELAEGVNINRVKMSFWSRHSYPFYTMMVGVMDNPTDPTTFVPVAYVDNGSSTGVKYFEFDFSKYEGEGRYIAFKNVRRTNNELDGHFTDLHSVNYIDDITLTLMPETDCTIELADLPYTENFDAITSSTNTETGATPVCWEVVKEDAAMSLVTAPQVYYNSSYAYNGYYSLRMVNRGVYAMPTLAEDIDINKVRLSMYVRQPNALYQLQVGVWDEVNETFTPVALVNNSSTGVEKYICDFSNYDGTGRRIAFRNVLGGGKTWSYSYNYIDNVVLSLAECAAITDSYTESFETVTTNTSTAATGAAPACWEVVEGSETLSYDGYPQVYYNGAFAHDGSYSLRMLDRCVYAMPEFADGVNIGDLSMTMYVRQPYSFYQLEVGVWNGTEFTVVETVNNSDDAVTKVTVDFGGYEGTGRIAFRNSLNSGKTWSYSYNYIDEISFTVNASKMSADGGNNLDEADVDRYLDNIAVYPNPTTGVLHIDAVDVEKVECYSQMGQLVGVYDNVNELNISELANGVYMLRITVPQGVTMRKVVKR